MEKVLITGGAGFIGYHLAQELGNLGYKVDVLDNFSRGVLDKDLEALAENANISLVTADILNSSSMARLADDYSYIYHLAAIIGVEHVLKHPMDVLTRNIELLTAMVKLAHNQRSLKKFVFFSTSEVYAGTLKYFEIKIPTPEDTHLTTLDLAHPRTSYMLSKIYGEAIMHQSDLPMTIVRPHNFYGPRMGMAHVIPQQMQKVYFSDKHTAIDVFNPEHMRTFCYISDAVELVIKLAKHAGSAGEAYNVGNENPEVSIRDVVNIVRKVVGVPVSFNYKDEDNGSPVRRCPSMKKAYALVGAPMRAVSLEDGIGFTYKWYRDEIFSGKQKSAK